MRWNWLKLRGNMRSVRRPQRRTSYRPMLEALEIRLVPSADVLTYHNDLARTGANLGETILTPSNVNSTNFGKLFTYSVDGQVYASPLYKSNVTIAGMGTFNVAYVATEHDSIYAFDTDNNTSGPNHDGILWNDSFINPAMGINVVLSGDVSCGQISPEIGITGTPVIDPSTGTMYLVAMTKETVGTTTSYHQKLHALDITTGAESLGGPVDIQASVPGTGDGGSVVNFIPKNYKERMGLVLLNGVVYTSWASHCDITPSHGWVIGYDAQTLQQSSVFCTSPNGQLDTIWGGSGSIAADADGNIYFETGNGSYNTNLGNYSESFLKLSSADGSLSVADFFTPFNYQALDNADRDLGSGAPILLPDQPGDHQHLMVGSGKEGRIYLINRDNLGGLNNPPNGPDLIVQELPPNTIVGGSWDTPAYFDAGSDGNRWIYYAGNGDRLKAFSLTNGLLSTSPSSQSAVTFSGSYGATPIVSANGTSNGIVWAVKQGNQTGQRGILYAYDATNLATELYDSNQAGTRDQLERTVKFATPTLADGKVFVGTNSTLTIFGLFQGPVLAPIPDQTITADQQTLDVPLTVSNPGGFPLTFSPSGQSLAYVLTQQTGTLTYDSTLDNFGGRNEKWLQDPGGQWYFILPTGELDVWDGGSGASGTLLGIVGVSYYTDPTLLTNPPANEPHATFMVTLSTSTLTITRDLAWTSSMVVTVTVDNGHGTDTKTFNLTVTTGPAPPGNVPPTVVNPSGNPLTYTVAAHSLAYVLTQRTGTLTYDSTQDIAGGRGEKWLQDPRGQWHFILPSGEFYVWNGVGGVNGNSLGNLGASYYSDPTRLTDPPANEAHATFVVMGSTLTITRDLALTSTMVLTLVVDDGSQRDSKTFDVFVTP